MYLFYYKKPLTLSLFLLTLLTLACVQTPPEKSPDSIQEVITEMDDTPVKEGLSLTITRDVPIRQYFEFMDSLMARLDTLLLYPVSEHVLVLNNPWLIDTLVDTDYYRLKAKGIFVEDPQSLLALRKGDVLQIPDSAQAARLKGKLATTVLDVNIPEFKLRILEDGRTLYTFPVRVGKNETKFLAMVGREVDLRTKTGEGKIVSINRKPVFINPVDSKRYDYTKRDDGMVTRLPGTPWLEPELDGHRFGQLIHPTTNPVTLGKPSSNGCIGMSEGDMWRVYYHAPLGTRVVVRYDLEVIDDQGQATTLNNIYPGFEHRQKREEVITAASSRIDSSGKIAPVCDCRTPKE